MCCVHVTENFHYSLQLFLRGFAERHHAPARTFNKRMTRHYPAPSASDCICGKVFLATAPGLSHQHPDTADATNKLLYQKHLHFTATSLLLLQTLQIILLAIVFAETGDEYFKP